MPSAIVLECDSLTLKKNRQDTGSWFFDALKIIPELRPSFVRAYTPRYLRQAVEYAARDRARDIVVVVGHSNGDCLWGIPWAEVSQNLLVPLRPQTIIFGACMAAQIDVCKTIGRISVCAPWDI